MEFAKEINLKHTQNIESRFSSQAMYLRLLELAGPTQEFLKGNKASLIPFYRELEEVINIIELPSEKTHYVRDFYNLLLNEIEKVEESADGKSEQRILLIADAIFSSPHEFHAYLPFSERVLPLAKIFDRPDLPEARQALSGSLVNSFAFAEEEAFQKVCEKIGEQSIPEILALVHMLEEAHALARVSSNGEEALRKIEVFVTELEKKTVHPIVTFAIEYLKDQLRFNIGEYVAFQRRQRGLQAAQPECGLGIITTYTNRGTIETLNGVNLREALADSRYLPFGNEAELPYKKILFGEMHRSGMREFIEGKLKISLSEVTVRAQIQLLSYVSGRDIEKFTAVQNASSREGLNRKFFYETFLCLCTDPSIVEELLDFVKDAPVDYVNAVFKKYEALIFNLEDIENIANDFFIKGKEYTLDTRKVIEQIVLRANKILRDCFQFEETNLQKNLDSLEKIKTDMVLFASVFKAAVEEGAGIELLDIQGVDLERKNILTNIEKDSVIQLVTSTRDSRPEIVASLENDLQRAFRGEKNTFYLLKKDGVLKACIRFEQNLDGTVHAANLSVDERTQNSGLGRVFSREVFQTESKQAVLKAEVFIDLPALEMYIEENGFIIEGIETNYRGTERAYWKIVRNDLKNKNFILKTEASSVIQAQAKSLVEADKHLVGEPLVVKVEKTESIAVLAEKFLSQGYRIVRYFTDRKNNIKYYAFEQEAVSRQEELFA